MRVLIVEDDAMFREVFKRDLCEHFPSVVIEEATNRDEALQKIRAVLLHLILMDICLPGTNGLRLTRKIKKDSPGITIAVLTSYDLPEYREAAVESGADRFFVKSSFKWDDFEALVKSISPGVP